MKYHENGYLESIAHIYGMNGQSWFIAMVGESWGGGGERERGGASSAILNYTRETTNKWLKTIWQVLDYVELCRIRACIYQTLTNWMGEAFHVQKLITKYRNIFLSNGLHAMLCTKRT